MYKLSSILFKKKFDILRNVAIAVSSLESIYGPENISEISGPIWIKFCRKILKTVI